jgi:ankyrin repeat protein
MADQDWLNLLLGQESRCGRSDDAKALLDAGADGHALDDWALRVASRSGRTETVKLLLEKGADVHAGDDYALRVASLNGHTETVKVLEAAMKSPARPVAKVTPQVPAP